MFINNTSFYWQDVNLLLQTKVGTLAFLKTVRVSTFWVPNGRPKSLWPTPQFKSSFWTRRRSLGCSPFSWTVTRCHWGMQGKNVRCQMRPMARSGSSSTKRPSVTSKKQRSFVETSHQAFRSWWTWALGRNLGGWLRTMSPRSWPAVVLHARITFWRTACQDFNFQWNDLKVLHFNFKLLKRFTARRNARCLWLSLGTFRVKKLVMFRGVCWIFRTANVVIWLATLWQRLFWWRPSEPS